MAFNLEQNNRLILAVAQFEDLLAEADEDGAEGILDELYMLVTKVLDRFPNLDNDDAE